MMDDNTINKIDKILEYLPLFSDKDYECIKKQSSCEPDENGVYSYPDIVYKEEVDRFFEILSDSFWTDSNYLQKNASKILGSNDLIDKSTFEQIKTLLTFCTRGERFCTGHWNAVIKSGKITKILFRLKK